MTLAPDHQRPTGRENRRRVVLGDVHNCSGFAEASVRIRIRPRSLRLSSAGTFGPSGCTAAGLNLTRSLETWMLVNKIFTLKQISITEFKFVIV